MTKPVAAPSSLVANSPRTLSPLPPHWERKIAARWLELLPRVRVWAQHSPLALDSLAQRHRIILTRLLRDDIEMRVVRRLALDDIRHHDVALAARRLAYLTNSQHPRYTQRKGSPTHAD